MKFYVGGNKIAGKNNNSILAGVLSAKMAFWLKMVIRATDGRFCRSKIVVLMAQI